MRLKNNRNHTFSLESKQRSDMEKFKAKQLRRLKTQKEGWKKALQIISQKFKPNQTVEDIQRLLKDCGDGTVNFTDRPIDAATTDELNTINKKCSIECKVQGRTTRQYYALAKEKFEQFSKECDEFEINYKRRQKIRRERILLFVGVTAVLLCGFISLGGAKWLLAEKYIHEGNYEAALNLDSQYENYFGSKEVKYEIAEAYLQNAEYGKAKELFAKCGYFKDAKNKVQEAERKRKEVILQSLGLEAISLEDIYTLGNVIPCGLVKYTVSYDNLLNADSDNLVDKTEDSLTYGNYFLYGYLCNIKYYFDANKLLSKIEVISPYGQDKRRFGYSDMTEITDEIQDKLNVEPNIYVNPNANYDCDVFRFEFVTNEGLRYEFVSNDIGPLEEDSCQGISKRFRLTIAVM